MEISERSVPLNKADICRRLHAAAEFHLLGAGSWPADRESLGSFWKLLGDLGLTEDVPGEPATSRYTVLGKELNVELMMIFAGAVDLWEIPLLLDLMGYLDDDEADAIYSTTSKHPDRVIRRHVLRVYLKFCNRSKLLN
jgi:hypothetical protein